jgi:GR25 family glycosyltransferase involved in LPS biosynthesis
MKLHEAFEAVFIITLKHRPDRRVRVWDHVVQESGLWAKGAKPIIVHGVSGDAIPPPKWWGAGNGAWGCLLSHSRVIEQALHEGFKNWLVLEDDVVFHPRAAAHFEAVMSTLPSDWGQLYLGGQHLREPVHHSELIFRGANVNRTHAFAMTRRVAAKVHAHIWHAPDYIDRKGWHIDHQLGLAHERRDWPVYCPKWWLAGQEGGSSNISGRQDLPRQFWQPAAYARQLPFFWGQPTSATQEEGLHWGNHHRMDVAWSDIGLNDAVGNPERLARWLELIATEAISMGRLPAAWHECLGLADLRPLWPARVYPIDHYNPGLLDYPWNGLFHHPYAALRPTTAAARPAVGLGTAATAAAAVG